MALSFNPNAVSSLHSLAYCKFFIGSIEEAISLEEQAIRRSPRDPFIGVRYRQIGLVRLVQSRTNEAVVWLEKARNANRAHSDIRAQLASAYALAGQTERAARTRRGPQAERRRPLFEPRSLAGRRKLRGTGAEGPRPARSHLYRRPPQGRHAGGVTGALACSMRQRRTATASPPQS